MRQLKWKSVQRQEISKNYFSQPLKSGEADASPASPASPVPRPLIIKNSIFSTLQNDLIQISPLCLMIGVSSMKWFVTNMTHEKMIWNEKHLPISSNFWQTIIMMNMNYCLDKFKNCHTRISITRTTTSTSSIAFSIPIVFAVWTISINQNPSTSSTTKVYTRITAISSTLKSEMSFSFVHFNLPSKYITSIWNSENSVQKYLIHFPVQAHNYHSHMIQIHHQSLHLIVYIHHHYIHFHHWMQKHYPHPLP